MRRSLTLTVRRCLWSLIVVLVVSAAAIATIAVGSLPRHGGELRVAALQAPVQIRRDAHGVPYIEALNEHDGYLALGFVHAQDRLWQMEFRRRLGSGRMAEILSGAGVETDRFMRLLRLHRIAAANLEAMSPPSRELVQAYTAGVNAFLEQRRRLLPPEFWLLWHRPEPWTDADSVVWLKLMALDLASNWRHELRRARLARDLPPSTYEVLFPDHDRDEDATLAAIGATLGDLDLAALQERIGPPPPMGHGSNGWVVDGERSANGAPMLANDPHLAFQLPGIWYLAGLKTPEFEVVGATLPGLPVFVIGRTDQIAWGMTNTGSDVQDLVIEQLVGDPPEATRTLTGAAPLDTVETTIRCRFCDDELFISRWSTNGPLISDLVGSAARAAGPLHALALRWAALDPSDVSLEAGFALPRARDWAGFEAALERFTNPQQNIFYADRDGTIGMLSPGRVPIRAAGDGTLPMRGWLPEGAWDGFIPYDELPRRRGSDTGFIANANNQLVDGAYPYFLSRRWDAPYRFERIRERLQSRPHDLDAARELLSDTRSGVANDLLPLFLAAAPLSEPAAAWARRLAAWDRHARPTSREQTVFAAWYASVADQLYADELGALLPLYGSDRPRVIRDLLERRHHWCDDVRTEVEETCPLILARALETAITQLEQVLGPESDDWAWSRQHPAVLAHEPLGRFGALARPVNRHIAIGGDDTTVNAASYDTRSTPPLFPSRHGVSYRQIVDLGRPEASRFITASGQVGHPLSRHFDDLTTIWAQGQDIQMEPPLRAAAALLLVPR